MGLLDAVPAGRVAVASEFSGDRAGRTTENLRDLTDAPPGPLAADNEISLFLGELVIRHGCNPFLPDEEVTSITSHPPKNQGVALSM